MKTLATLLIASACACQAFQFMLLNPDGSPFANQGAVNVDCTESVRADGSRQLHCKVTSLQDAKLFLKLAAVSDDFKGDSLVVFNGKNEKPFTAPSVSCDLLKEEAFLLGAVWSGNRGLALALGAEDMNSFADFKAEKTNDASAVLQVAVNAAFLHRGQFYECNFHQLAFNPKYGIRDALAHYYSYYPKRFKRDETVNQKIFGICAEYGAWILNSPERCRLSNATWEWCHAAERSWGDICAFERPDTPQNYFWVDPLAYYDRDGRRHDLKASSMTNEEFTQIQKKRLAFGYRCGIANGFYTMALSVLSNKIANRYPDSLPTHHNIPSGYHGGTDVFTFPEVGWGRKFREDLTFLAKNYDIGCLAFDVSDPHGIYRGEALAEMNNVGFDQFGEGVVRGVASAKLFEFIRQLDCKDLPGKIGVAINTFHTQITDMLYADNVMVERAPWDKEPPFPMEYRFAIGEKALQLWEGYSLDSFDPNCRKWSKEQHNTVINDLSHFAVHRSFECGASLPAYFLTEYIQKVALPFCACNDAGWKPVLGASAPPETQLARYGLGENALLSVNNLRQARQKISMEIFPAELRSGYVDSNADNSPLIFASYVGAECQNTITQQRQHLNFDIPSQLVAILEAVGSAEGSGTLNARWTGAFDQITLTFASTDFSGTIRPKHAFGTYTRTDKTPLKLNPGDKIAVTYRNHVMSGTFASAKSILPKDGQPCVIRYAAGQDSRDIAERFKDFFKEACASRANLVQDDTLPAFTVVMGKTPAQLAQGIRADSQSIAVHAEDRHALDDLARRALNAINSELYPKYIPQVPMKPEDATYFSFQRY